MYICKTLDFSANLYALHSDKMSFNYKVYMTTEGMLAFVFKAPALNSGVISEL